VCYNWVHNKIISVTSATTTTVLGNVKVVTIYTGPHTTASAW